MGILAAQIRRDWQVMRSRMAPWLLDATSVFVGAALFYYLGENVSTIRGEEFFAFAVAGLAVLRVNTAVPRTLEAVRADIAGGNMEFLWSSSRRTSLVHLGTTAFELIRGVILAIAFIALAATLFDAPFDTAPEGIAAVAIGLGGAAVVFSGLAVATIGIFLVVRQAGAIGSLTTLLMPILAGAYFPTSTLPDPFDAIAAALPFRRAVDVIREGMLDGQLDAAAAVVLWVEALAIVAIGVVIAHVLVERARRQGSLAME